MSPAAFLAAARSYKGVRWHHLGRSREGLDCVGLLLCAADDAGVPRPMDQAYARGRTGFDLCAVCEKIGRQINPADAQDGDILVFACGVFPGHLGIRTTIDGRPYVLHAPINRRKVVEEELINDLLASLRRAYRPTAFEGAN